MADGLRQGKLGYGHIKNMLLDAIIEETSEAREKYEYYNHIYTKKMIYLDFPKNGKKPLEVR